MNWGGVAAETSLNSRHLEAKHNPEGKWRKPQGRN